MKSVAKKQKRTKFIQVTERDIKLGEPNSPVDEVGRKYFKCENLDADSDMAAPDLAEGRIECTRAEANLISSETMVGTHKPVLDIDIPARYVPSSTAGHGHLYIDHPLPWVAYEKLLTALKDAVMKCFEIGDDGKGH